MTVVRSIAILLLPILLSAGCGQKGPLYLEGREPRSQKSSTAKNTKPVQPESAPADKDPAQDESR